VRSRGFRFGSGVVSGVEAGRVGDIPCPCRYLGRWRCCIGRAPRALMRCHKTNMGLETRQVRL
jgi:hypothetical protein